MTSHVTAYRSAILHSIADPAQVGVEQSYQYFEDGLLVVGAEYDLESGRVDFFDGAV